MNYQAEDVIRTEGLSKTYGKGKDQVHALRGVNLNVSAGSVFGLLGANGSGKSTLIRVLTTLVAPTAGRAWLQDCDVDADPARAREMIGVTGQRTSLDDRLSGAENLRIIGRLYGLTRAQSQRTAAELLEKYDLQHAAGRPVNSYSGGMRRRLDIVSGLIRRPAILFLDEPTTGLDPRSRSEIWDAIRGLADSGTTILLTTQYLEEVDRLADRVAVLAAGEVVADSTPHNLKARIGTQLSVKLGNLEDRVVAYKVLADLGVTRLGEVDDPAFFGHAFVGHIDAHVDHLPLPRLLSALTGAGIEVADIGLSDPTLDEAYLALTEEKK